MNLSADLLRGYTDTVLLCQLEKEDSYGYRISKNVLELSEGGLELKEATLYTAFRRLENAGLIRSWWGDEATGARRRYYSITEEGRKKLTEDRASWMESRDLLDKLISGGAL